MRLPFTTKEDLRLNYPYGMFAVPLREVLPNPLLIGHHRKADSGWLHQKRSENLVEPGCAFYDRCWCKP